MHDRLKRIFLVSLVPAALLIPSKSYAAQAKVLLADGRTVTIDIGADRELRVGMEADVFRETEAIIHPVTGENLGRHKVKIARIRIDRVEANTSLGSYVARLATVRMGDRVEGLELAPTYEEEIRAEVLEARADIKAISRTLVEEIRRNEKEIAKIQGTLSRVATTEQRMNTLINSVMNMREHIVAIEGRLDTLSRHSTIIDSISEVQRLGISDFRELGVLTRDEDEAIYIQVGTRVFLLNLETEQLEDATALATSGSSDRSMEDAVGEMSDEDLFPEEDPEETPFYLAYWWIAPVIGVLGGAVLFLMKMMRRGSAPQPVEADTEDEAFPEADPEDDGGDDLELPEEIPELEEAVETAEEEKA